MKVIILAGGFGTRLAEFTDTIPKPMVPIGGKPILWHIMNRYAYFGHKDFYIALGYKSEVVKEYFMKFSTINSDFSVNLETGNLKLYNKNKLDWNVTLIETGNETMTGGRLKRLEPYIDNQPFMLTYGDGLADVNIDNLLSFHKKNNRMVTVTAVRPVARFGELEIDGTLVTSFQEKPQVNNGWINGGFFVCQPDFLKYIKSDSTVLEKEPLEIISSMGKLVAYKHEGFWQCMDTKRDKDFLEGLWASKKPPWV